MTIEEYQRLKKEMGSLNSKEFYYKGILEQLHTRLKEEFDLDDVESAKEYLTKNAKKLANQEKELDRRLEDIQWKNRL